MKKTLALALSLLMLFTLCLPCASAASGGFLNTPRLSTANYTPADGNCLYIYVPLTGKRLSCTVEIQDNSGVLVMRETRTGLSTNVQTFFWDGRPAANNAGAYDPAAFAHSGSYSVTILVTGSGVEDKITLPLYVTEPGTSIDNEAGIPNYTGDAECDYMAALILQEINVEGLTNTEKYRKIYTWVEQTLYRENSVYARPLDETGYAFDLSALSAEIRTYKNAVDSMHEQGLLNYNVHGDLETKVGKRMMLERVGTCYEFSSILQILLEHVGIECHVLDGYFHNSNGSVVVHKWNQLRLDGQYYCSDVRIDNASYERTERTKLFYDYYLEKDTDTWKERHSWDESVYPVLTTATQALEPGAVGSAPVTPVPDPAPSADPVDPSAGYTSAPYPLSAFADRKDRKTKTTDAALTLSDGRSFQLEAYNIDGYNYFKLRDIAYILSGTRAQFEVDWSETFNCVFLLSGMPYTPMGGELVSQSLVNPTASPSANRILFWGDEISLCGYFINGNNYFRLRDLAILFNFGVGWSEETNTILLMPDSLYTE